MKKLQIQIEEELMIDLKILAAKRGITLKELVTSVLKAETAK